MNVASPSRIRKRNRSIWSSVSISRFRAACVTHSPVGRAVTRARWTRRRSTSRLTAHTAGSGRLSSRSGSRTPTTLKGATSGTPLAAVPNGGRWAGLQGATPGWLPATVGSSGAVVPVRSGSRRYSSIRPPRTSSRSTRPVAGSVATDAVGAGTGTPRTMLHTAGNGPGPRPLRVTFGHARMTSPSRYRGRSPGS